MGHDQGGGGSQLGPEKDRITERFHKKGNKMKWQSALLKYREKKVKVKKHEQKNEVCFFSFFFFFFNGQLQPTALIVQIQRNIYSAHKKELGKLHGVLLFNCLLNEDTPIQRPFQILHYCWNGYNSLHKIHAKQQHKSTCTLNHGQEGEKATVESATSLSSMLKNATNTTD